MNKLVYLFELDSVRKTDKEVYKGQLAMYDELVGNGNIIVMSMNQITDSKAFLCMLQNNEHYNVVKELLQKGYIRISRYGEIRTVSQYVQNAINKNLAKNNDVFIFSAIPVKSNQKLLLKLMQKVLVNTDLSIIQEYIDMTIEDNEQVLNLFEEYGTDGKIKKPTIDIKKAKKYLEFLYRFLEMIILISMYGKSVTPPIKYDEKYEKKDFYNMINEIISFDCNESEFPLWKETIIILEEIKDQLIKDSDTEKNNRSVWLKKIKELEEIKNKTNLQYAELIINLCYNYTIEFSIYGASKHYERNNDIKSFKTEFFSRLKHDWNNGEEAIHRFLQEETNEYMPYEKEYPNWERGIRIISRRKCSNIDFRDMEQIPLYEYCYKERRRKEKTKDTVNILKVFVTTFIYVIAIYCINKTMSLLENQINPFLKSFITFVLIAFLSAAVDKLFPIPNILECFHIIRKSIIDLFMIIRRKPASYINSSNLGNDYMEEKPNILKQEETKSRALQEYITLWKNRPGMFEKSDKINIVEPNEDGIKEILQYETMYNKNIGVVYRSAYNIFVVDLIRDMEGKYSTYERLMPTVQEGAVVIVPLYKNKFILLNQFRHSIRESQLAFPRGYGDIDIEENVIKAENNAIKEIQEELGAELINKPQKLGTVIADSGISANKVIVYIINVDKYKEKVGYEGIENIQLKTKEEMIDSIRNGEINDGYTLAAYTLYMNKSQ